MSTGRVMIIPIVGTHRTTQGSIPYAPAKTGGYGIRPYDHLLVTQSKKPCHSRAFCLSRVSPDHFLMTFLHQVRLLQFGHFKYRVVPLCIAFSACL